MAAYLLREARVAVVPGHGERFNYFGSGVEGHIRIIYSTTRGTIVEAWKRWKKLSSKL